jgi:hypothetical protein
MGLTPASKLLQRESMDADLRVALWNALRESVFADEYADQMFLSGWKLELFKEYWRGFFNKPIDELPDQTDLARELIRKWFFESKWFEVYDFLEFTAIHCSPFDAAKFCECANSMLQRENSAYRFVHGSIAEIVNPEEIRAIEEAGDTAFEAVNLHISTAVALLADRRKPDYRNSIKESISAVESLVKQVCNNDKATLGDLLGELQRRSGMHGALKNALSALYGYTSDEAGIRHALLENDTVTFDDAKFLLVTCSAFVNYVISKLSDAHASTT